MGQEWDRDDPSQTRPIAIPRYIDAKTTGEYERVMLKTTPSHEHWFAKQEMLIVWFWFLTNVTSFHVYKGWCVTPCAYVCL